MSLREGDVSPRMWFSQVGGDDTGPYVTAPMWFYAV
jgi:hypothetical protein